MQLRNYQSDAKDAAIEALERDRSTLVVMATGLGKTVLVGHLIKHYMTKGRVKFLAHREELIQQGAQTLKRICDVRPAIEMGDQWSDEQGMWGDKAEIVVSSIQTQIAGMSGQGRMSRFKPEDFSLVVIDEAHHAPADSYRKTIDYYMRAPNVKLLGVTATPNRADEKALGQIFNSVAYEYGILQGINDGWLVPVMQQFVMCDDLDLSSVRTTAGDLNGKDLAEVIEREKVVHQMIDPTLELTEKRQTLIFAASVAQAEMFTEILNRHRPDSAQSVFGHTKPDQRRQTIAAYRASRFQYLVNVGVATEGFDVASIAAIVMARPTKSQALYAQMAGRGTRPLPGLVENISAAQDRRDAIATSDKQNVLIIDFVGNSGRHKLCTSFDILGGKYDDEVIDRAVKDAQEREDGGPIDVDKELIAAQEKIREEERARRAAERARVKARASYSSRSIDPFDVLDIMPEREPGWFKGKPPSPKMVALLERFGIDNAGDLTFWKAKALIGRLIERSKNELATFKQTRVLVKNGYEDASEMTFLQAKAAIDELARNNWRRPAPREAEYGR